MSGEVSVRVEGEYMIFEKDKTSDLEVKVYNPDFFKMLGFGDAIFDDGQSSVLSGGGPKDTFPYRQFVFLLTGKDEDTSNAYSDVDNTQLESSKQVPISNTYKYFSSVVKSFLKRLYPNSSTKSRGENADISQPEGEVAEDGAKPAPEGDVTPVAEDGAKPEKPDGDVTEEGPAPEGEVTEKGAAPEGEVTPVAEDGAKPAPEGDVTPVAEEGAEPEGDVTEEGAEPEGEVTPVAEEGVEPEGDVTPVAEEGPAPEGDVTPVAEEGAEPEKPDGEVTPVAEEGAEPEKPDGDVTPVAEEGPAPEGDITPVAEEGPAPEGDVTPVEEKDKFRWKIKIPIKNAHFKLSAYEKAEITARYQMKENRAAKMYNISLKGEIYDVGNRVIRIGEVIDGYNENTYTNATLPGTIMEKIGKMIKIKS